MCPLLVGQLIAHTQNIYVPEDNLKNLKTNLKKEELRKNGIQTGSCR